MKQMIGNVDWRYILLLFPIICGIAFAMVTGRERRIRKKNEELKMRESMRDERNREIERYRKDSKVLAEKVLESIEKDENLAALVQECADYTGELFSDNPAVDALLAYKKKIGTKQGVRVDFSIGEIPANLIPEKELVSLLGNLMDNAIEAAAKCEKGWVKAESRRIKGQWTLRITNAKPEEEKPLENYMATTKQDVRHHGLGALIIKKIVTKNKGYIKQYDQGKTFEMFLSLPVKKESESCGI